MADVQIVCINKPNRDSQHEAITHLGSSTQKWTRQQIISWIEAREHTFYTLVGGKRADIGVFPGPNGKYLRTYADNQWNNNLLSLPECP